MYFKQAWNLIKQEKLFSSLYIIGTGLSITVVMVLSIVYYIRIANIYPETNRDRMLIVRNAMEEFPDGNQNSSLLSYQTVETCFYPLKEAEAVSAVCHLWEEHYVQPEGSKDQLPVTVNYVDNAFWKVFSFRFLQGRPFTEADFQSGIHTAVISESMSKRLFGTTDAIGRYVSLNFVPYKICGVVKEVSFVTNTTYAQLWIPYTVTDYRESFTSTLGQFAVYILAPTVHDMNKVRMEALENVRKYNNTFEGKMEFKLSGQPDRHWESTFRFWSHQEIDFIKIGVQYSLIFLILLLIPGISLSGMTDSRMERRMSEMGIRRAFGAPVKTLMWQVFSENFFFTLLGGLAGLLFSYLLILVFSDWMINIGLSDFSMPPEGAKVTFTLPMLLNIPVFLIALGVCFLLNIIAALLPAWRAAHKEIVFSLHTKS